MTRHSAIGCAALGVLVSGCLGGDLVESLSGEACRVVETTSATAAWTSATVRRCASDDGCALVCSACVGCQQIPVGRDYAAVVNAEREARCADTTIRLGTSGVAAVARCVDGRCTSCSASD